MCGKEYNTKIDDKTKASIKNEIKSAIPELNKALEPLISSAVNAKQNTL